MSKNKHRVLFVCKQRNDKYGVSFGLVNSCHFVCNKLRQHGIEAKTSMVIDNNYIDREVASFKPTHVFIEALWVVPEKFHVLIPLHPSVKWNIRLHSRVPFLAHEGIAVDWLKRYYRDIHKKYPDRFFLSSNNWDLFRSLRYAFKMESNYFPNIYCPPDYQPKVPNFPAKEWVDIGCFGAVRPMKNHLYQALAAISFGNKIGKKIRFHINANRIEQKGEPVLKNIEKCFEGGCHELVPHEWMSHDKFINLVRSMDIGMQVSFSESFNIVAADFVYNDIPIVGSPEIRWLTRIFKANPNNIDSIINTLRIAYYGKKFRLHFLNKLGLILHNERSVKIWIDNLDH